MNGVDKLFVESGQLFMVRSKPLELKKIMKARLLSSFLFTMQQSVTRSKVICT